MQVNIGANCWDGMRTKKLVTDCGNVVVVQKPKDSLLQQLQQIQDAAICTLGFILAPPLILRPVASAFAAAPASAVSGQSRETIRHAFDPLIDMVQALAYPIAGVMIAGGCLFIMIGMRDKGMDMLRNAALGYILVTLSPLLLELLVGVGKSV